MKTYTVEKLLAELVIDNLFYDESGGGVTFAGGKALLSAIKRPKFQKSLNRT